MVTSAQQQVYQYICQCLVEKAYSPSLREIAIGIGLSPLSKSIISRHVHALIEAGYLARDENGFHDLRIQYNDNKFVLPIVGRIAAGKPIEAVSQQEVLDLSAILYQEGCYVLEVKGDSMIGEGIWDGDRVICKKSAVAKQDDIAVVLIDQNDATLKRIQYRADKMISLIPANPQYKVQTLTPERVTIQGIFIGLLRLPRKNSFM